jgi:hypothetical protein
MELGISSIRLSSKNAYLGGIRAFQLVRSGCEPDKVQSDIKLRKLDYIKSQLIKNNYAIASLERIWSHRFSLGNRQKSFAGMR